MRCEVHEGLEAVGACEVCGRGACAECAGSSRHSGRVRCAKCERPAAVAIAPATSASAVTSPAVRGGRPAWILTLGFSGSLLGAIGSFSHVGVILVSISLYPAASFEYAVPATAVAVSTGLCCMAAGTRALRRQLVWPQGGVLPPLAAALACAFSAVLWLFPLIFRHPYLSFVSELAAYATAGAALFLTGGALVLLPPHAPARASRTASFVLLTVGAALVGSGLASPSSVNVFVFFGGWIVAGVGLLLAARVFLAAGARRA